MGIFFAAAVWPLVSAPRWLRFAIPAICAVVFLSASAAADRYFFQPCDDEDAVAPMVQVYRSGGGFQGTDEYEPPRADDTVVATGLPDACLTTDPDTTLGVLDTPGANPDWWGEQHSCDAIFSTVAKPSTASPEHLRFIALMPHAGYLILRLRTYPAWRIRLNSKPAGPLVQRDDGLVCLPVAQGPMNLDIDWITTPDVVIGRWLSVLALLLVIGLWLVQPRIRATSHAGLS